MPCRCPVEKRRGEERREDGKSGRVFTRGGRNGRGGRGGAKALGMHHDA